MGGTNLWIFLGFIVLIGNLVLTREIVNHVLFIKERLLLLAILWLIPVVGLFYSFRKLGFDYYETTESTNTVASPDIMGMGDYFNPNAKTEQVIEEKYKSAPEENIFERESKGSK
ncbi:MAG: hypothetical protein COA71_08755 [SAR86 cluster bacterium]|uniref:Uncharacterized protein n=1 Tax=SAR86 cluster bacterium TaxID=2030880 RepID=A0A2A5CBC5_9GAMM|nr:hypothetical protein [Gammaproteobacteria bacterium AH-315-E17]PCJ41127.1 MAG: hypothetical protein COA71_08755 [SAR86 cluster bacterium]